LFIPHPFFANSFAAEVCSDVRLAIDVFSEAASTIYVDTLQDACSVGVCGKYLTDAWWCESGTACVIGVLNGNECCASGRPDSHASRPSWLVIIDWKGTVFLRTCAGIKQRAFCCQQSAVVEVVVGVSM
jgi:hypothetical protein